MLSRDIHYGKPTVANAIDHLDIFLKEVKEVKSLLKLLLDMVLQVEQVKLKTLL